MINHYRILYCSRFKTTSVLPLWQYEMCDKTPLDRDQQAKQQFANSEYY